jgi:hypothetical protein
MITATQCAAYAGLNSSEIVLGAVPPAAQQSLLSSYLYDLAQGPATVRDMIVSDLRVHLELGERQRAAELLVVLSCFFSDYPEARIETQEAAVQTLPDDFGASVFQSGRGQAARVS